MERRGYYAHSDMLGRVSFFDYGSALIAVLLALTCLGCISVLPVVGIGAD